MLGMYYYWCTACSIYTTSTTDYSGGQDRNHSSLKCNQCDGVTDAAVVVYPDKDTFPESMSHGQRLLSTFLDGLGLTVDVEAKIGTRFADVFLPELNTVVEFDGPTHVWKSAEVNRDSQLKESGVAEILHIKDTTAETFSWLRTKLEEISEGSSGT